MAIDPKIIDQFNLLQQALPDVRAYPADWLERGVDYEYLYREDTILMRDAGKPAVAAFVAETLGLKELDPTSPDDSEDIKSFRAGRPVQGRFLAESPIPGLTQLRFAGVRNADGSGSVPDVLARLDATEHGAGTAHPEAVLHICGNCCPAEEPNEVTEQTVDPVPPVAVGCDCDPPCDGAGVNVSVVDTGWIKEAEQRYWLNGVTGDQELTHRRGTDEIQDYAGHGTFVPGCVRLTAPKAKIHVDGSMTTAGAVYETDLVKHLTEALQSNPDVVVFPFSTSTRNGKALAGFDALYENVIRQQRLKGMVIIASAGCDETADPSWPAAYKWVVSVGALEPCEQPTKAHFSNFGPFVDVFVLGEDLVNAYATGTLVCKEYPHVGEVRTFNGMARWSGTSFSTALFAGMIAARKSHTKETGRQAADALLALAESQHIDGLGPVLRLDQACVRNQ